MVGQAVAGQGAAVETWPSISSPEKSISGFAALLLHVLCGAGDRVLSDDGIYVPTSFGPGGIHWRGRGVRGMSCCA